MPNVAERRRRFGCVTAPFVALAVLLLVGPWIGRAADRPALGASAAQLLEPGTRVQQARLDNGGLVRGLELKQTRDGLHVRGPAGWRVFERIQIDGRVRTRRMWLLIIPVNRRRLLAKPTGQPVSLVCIPIFLDEAMELAHRHGIAA